MRAAQLAERLALTGVWDGLFSYPRHLAAVPFTAVILQTGVRLGGTIFEQPTDGRFAGQVLNAMVEGEHEGAAVRFVKTYDAAHKIHGRPIRYDGVLSRDGTEIEGRWSIPGNWSGKFLMMRSGRGLQAARLRRKQAVPAG